MAKERKIVALTVLLCLLLPATLQLIPKANSTISETDKAYAFLADVLQIDLSRYQPTTKFLGELEMNGVGQMYEVHGTLLDDIEMEFGSKMSALSFIIYLKNGAPYYYSISGANMSQIIYSQTQPDNALDRTKDFLQRYKTYLIQYCEVDTAYLQPMINMLNKVSMLAPTEQVLDTVKMKIDHSAGVQQISSIQSAWIASTDIKWVYTYNDIEVARKNISFDYPNGTLSHFKDCWNLYTVGTWHMISEQEAISLAYSEAEKLTVNIGSDQGVTTIKPDLTNSTVQASLNMIPREDNVLYPYWSIEICFNQHYGNQYGIQVGIWGDTKEITNCQVAGYLGGPLVESTPTPSLTTTLPPTNSDSPTEETPTNQQHNITGNDTRLNNIYMLSATIGVLIGTIVAAEIIIKRNRSKEKT